MRVVFTICLLARLRKAASLFIRLVWFGIPTLPLKLAVWGSASYLKFSIRQHAHCLPYVKMCQSVKSTCNNIWHVVGVQETFVESTNSNNDIFYQCFLLILSLPSLHNQVMGMSDSNRKIFFILFYLFLKKYSLKQRTWLVCHSPRITNTNAHCLA